MKEIKLSPQELKEAIDFGKLIGSGFFSSVFTYKGRLIKLDKDLYRLLKNKDPKLSTDAVKTHYKWDIEDFNDRDQLEELERRQPFIRPIVPEGIVTLKDVDSKINGVSPGIIIHPFTDYQNLSKVPKDDYKRLLILFKKVFEDLKNLADKQIAQEDIMGHVKSKDFNILQKGDDPQLIDMSGQMVTVGGNFTTPNEMYRDFGRLINYYYHIIGLTPVRNPECEISEEVLIDMITEFEKQTKNK